MNSTSIRYPKYVAFLTGMSKALDMYGVTTEYIDIYNPEQKDFEALRRDWQMVGNDITEAMNTYGKQTATSS